MQNFALPILAVLLTSPTVAEQTPVPTSPDLTGLGTFDFPFNPTAFSEFAASLVDDTVDITVTIDKAGAVTTCAVAPPTNEAGARLCEAAQQGHLQVPQWYKPTMAGGHFTLHLDAAVHRAVPVKPVQFVKAPQGLIVRLAVASGKCLVVDPRMDQTDQDAVCAAFDAAGRPGLKADGTWLYTDTALLVDADRQDYDVETVPVYPDRGQAVDFVQPPDPVTLLGKVDGRLHAELPGESYPKMVIQGTAGVLLGFDRTGTALTCRPVKSTDSSFLAWWTCDKLVRYARFDFAPGAPNYAGLRYFYASIRWTFPDN
jgi:hypothetical protein